MVSRHSMSERFILCPPASAAVIEQEEREYGGPLPREYTELLLISDGTHTEGNLSIFGAQGVVRRNTDYEVQTYLPGYFMIGDDGGGLAILLNLQDRRIYEVDMGAMDEASMEYSADTLNALVRLGTSLRERDS